MGYSQAEALPDRTAAARCGPMAQARVSFHLGPSKLWWAWLGLRSNPALAKLLGEGCERAVLFDEIYRLPVPARARTLYLFVLWDGVPDAAVLHRVLEAVGPDAPLQVLVVGAWGHLATPGFSLQTLFPAGPLSFAVRAPRLEMRSRLLLIGARLRSVAMPLKNLLAGRRALGRGVRLLLGQRQVVFCGSYGVTPRVQKALCVRYGVDPGLFAAWPGAACGDESDPAGGGQSLRAAGRFLAELQGQGAMPDALFLALVHLLGRKHVLQRMAAAGLPLFVHGYGAGANINVYTSPWYRQHLFADFGSVVGEGNYPRLADLQFFRKDVVRIDLRVTLPEVLAAAADGTLDHHFDRVWDGVRERLMAGNGGFGR